MNLLRRRMGTSLYCQVGGNVLTNVNHWLESFDVPGYPVWACNLQAPRFSVIADHHFSKLLAWCKENHSRPTDDGR